VLRIKIVCYCGSLVNGKVHNLTGNNLCVHRELCQQCATCLYWLYSHHTGTSCVQGLPLSGHKRPVSHFRGRPFCGKRTRQRWRVWWRLPVQVKVWFTAARFRHAVEWTSVCVSCLLGRTSQPLFMLFEGLLAILPIPEPLRMKGFIIVEFVFKTYCRWVVLLAHSMWVHFLPSSMQWFPTFSMKGTIKSNCTTANFKLKLLLKSRTKNFYHKSTDTFCLIAEQSLSHRLY